MAHHKRYVKPVKLVSLDFVNADLVYVLKLLAKELNVNLVTDQTVTGSVTMSLKDVSAQTAMNILVRLNGFQMKRMGSIVFVGSEETMNAITPDVIAYQPTGGAARVGTIKLQNISASDAIKAIKEQFPLVQASASPNGNAVVVSADHKTMAEIHNLVAGIDIVAPVAAAPPGEKFEVLQTQIRPGSRYNCILKVDPRFRCTGSYEPRQAIKRHHL